MEISAIAKYTRVSPKKLELLIRSIKSLPPKEAVQKLGFISKSGARPLRDVILSALANARDRNIGKEDELSFKSIQVLMGSTMKRFRPVSRGMAHSYRKRMSHIRVVLTTQELKPAASKINKPRQNAKVKDPASPAGGQNAK